MYASDANVSTEDKSEIPSLPLLVSTEPNNSSSQSLAKKVFKKFVNEKGMKMVSKNIKSEKNLDCDLWDHIISFTYDQDWKKDFFTLEGFDTRSWVIASIEMNLSKMFVNASRTDKWNILLSINRWLIKKYKKFSLTDNPNGDWELEQVAKTWKEIKKFIDAQMIDNDDNLSQENLSQAEIISKKQFFNAFFQTVYRMNIDEIPKFPSINLHLYCRENFLHFEKFYGNEFTDEARRKATERIKADPFPKTILGSVKEELNNVDFFESLKFLFKFGGHIKSDEFYTEL